MKPVPKPIICTTGDQFKLNVQRTIDYFLDETRNFIQDKYRDGVDSPSEIEIKSGELAFSQDGPITNKRVTYLTYRDNVIVTIFETRTQLNNLNYTFFRNLKNIKP